MHFSHFSPVSKRLAWGLVALVAVAACDEETTAGVPVAQSIAAVAGDNQSAPVGSTLPAPIEVVVTGSNGQPLSGATVEFVVLSRTGSVSPSSVTTGADGKASTTVTLGAIAERVSVQARVGGLTAEFSARAVAGAAATIEKVGGDAQDGGVGQALATALAVRLVDGNGNPVPGVDVDWSSAQGGTFAEHASDATGTARAVWTLGNAGGAQSAMASVGGTSTTFTARAFDCNPVAHTIGTTVNGSLLTTGESCPLPNGAFAEFYTVTSGAVVANSFDLSSGAFNPVITMEGSDGVAFAWAPSLFIGSATLVRVIQGAASYQITVTSETAGETGAFSLTSAASSVDNDVGCGPGEIFSASGVVSNQNLTATDCAFFDDGSNPWYSDWFAVYLEAGDQATIAMTSGNMDTYLQLIDPGFTGIIDADDDGGPGTSSLLVHDATETGVFTIDASTFNTLTTGTYTMQITISRSGSAPIARAFARLAPPDLDRQLSRITKIKQ